MTQPEIIQTERGYYFGVGQDNYGMWHAIAYRQHGQRLIATDLRSANSRESAIQEVQNMENAGHQDCETCGKDFYPLDYQSQTHCKTCHIDRIMQHGQTAEQHANEWRNAVNYHKAQTRE